MIYLPIMAIAVFVGAMIPAFVTAHFANRRYEREQAARQRYPLWSKQHDR